jgi:hypothetical protein
MVHAYHCIMSFYGFWLPNDPRGSWSTWIRQWELLRFGSATKVETTQSVARKPHDWQRRQSAKEQLKYPPVMLTGVLAREVGKGFELAISQGKYSCYACSILPEHVHLVMGRHLRKIEIQLSHLQANATRRLNTLRLNPLLPFKNEDGCVPRPWSRGEWAVYLNTSADVQRAIKYVENNPLKEGKRRQHWAFVRSYAPDMV